MHFAHASNFSSAESCSQSRPPTPPRTTLCPLMPSCPRCSCSCSCSRRFAAISMTRWLWPRLLMLLFGTGVCVCERVVCVWLGLPCAPSNCVAFSLPPAMAIAMSTNNNDSNSNNNEPAKVGRKLNVRSFHYDSLYMYVYVSAVGKAGKRRPPTSFSNGQLYGRFSGFIGW